MYKLEFTLKQHTPLIHFQHDQEGATLRATEVKPKLDQFIFEKITGKRGFSARIEFHHLLFHGGEVWTKRLNWLSGSSREIKPKYLNIQERNNALLHFSLNYKLKIPFVFPEFKTIERNFKFPCFFGDMGDNYTENIKGFSYLNTLLNCEIFTFDKSLKDTIALKLSDFFSLHNFGTRQSKGFGSFYLDPQSPFLSEYNLEFKLPNLKYVYDVTVPNKSIGIGV
ncbi:MAG: hypothetical protein NTU44_15865 [Bacteroidetes bacterium]|nr:hypothetical protein [Bacteroidota bacterium]